MISTQSSTACHAVDRSPSLRCNTSTRRLASSNASSWPRRHSRMSAMTAAVSSASLFIFLSRVASWRANRGPNGATSSPSSSSSLAIFSKPSTSTRNATAARHLRSRPWRSNPWANASTPCSFSRVSGGTKLPGASCTKVACSLRSCARLRTAAPCVAWPSYSHAYCIATSSEPRPSPFTTKLLRRHPPSVLRSVTLHPCHCEA